MQDFRFSIAVGSQPARGSLAANVLRPPGGTCALKQRAHPTARKTRNKDHTSDQVSCQTGEGCMLSQQNIAAITPTGARLVPGGATFKVWATRATAVYLNGSFAGVSYDQ